MRTRFNNVLLMIVATFGLFLTSSSQATDLNYNFLEAGYVFNADVRDVQGDGFRLRGSVEVAPSIILMGEILNLEFDNGGDVDSIIGGVGYVIRYEQPFDLLTSFEFGNQQASGPGGTFDKSGFRMGLGVRGRMSPQVEGFARYAYENFDGSDSYFEVGGAFGLNHQFSVGGTFQFGGDIDMMTISIRYYF